ncbi:trypsin-1-like [Schistocerca americana]|uniref:trypsin-1-like n=1 Tax=Schistocerca americana TaxID=7009 RepID=UPI001F4FE296|nr:trypsin-1-like [Schistocerca americana]
MLRQSILLLAIAACVLGRTLPVRRLPHSGPARRFAVARGRIYGGHNAAPGEFPWQVSLQWALLKSRVHNCGGSIITTTSVLTAAHCVVQRGHYIAVAGEHDFSKNEGTEQEIYVSQQIADKRYPGGGVVAPHDIAVFKLKSAFTLNSYVRIIPLVGAGFTPVGGSAAVVSGWGRTRFATTPNVLQTLDVTIIDHKTCSKLVDELQMGSNPLTDTMICTGPVYDGTSTCNGDSGGPLVQDGVLIGLVSWGVNPCAIWGAPSVFTSVSAHLEFVNERRYPYGVYRTQDQPAAGQSLRDASSEDMTPLRAVAGDYDMSTDEGTEQEVLVTEQIPHPQFNGAAGVGPYDVSVFKLQSALTLNSNVQTISLPSAGAIPEGGSIGVLSGWGTTEDGTQPNILQTVDLTIYDYEICKAHMDELDPTFNPLTETMVCTGPFYEGISICAGDSGGPLEQNQQLIGIVSFTMNPCGAAGAPSIFTRVSAYLDFINENL